MKKNRSFLRLFLLFFILMGIKTSALATTWPLPIEDSPVCPPLLSNYGDDPAYEDESITVSFSEGRLHETDYWLARIKIKYPSQLRTASANGFDSSRTIKGLTLYRRMNAVLAINGDYFSYIPDGYLIRQGKLYRDLPSGKRDILLIDDKGDFYPVLMAGKAELEPYQDKKIINSFNFGPALVIEGQRVEEYTDNNNAALLPRQRMAIAQTKRGSLEYVVLACAGPRGRNTGMTLDEFSRLIFKQGVDNAYNLDGGYSTMLMFNNAYVNTGDVGNIRAISDIIYFASALSTCERQEQAQ